MGPRKTSESDRQHGHALFATVDTADGTQTLTFRVGQPIPGASGYARALARFARLWEAGMIDHGQRRRPAVRTRIRYRRRWYRVRFMEVRATDRHGRGLGRDDHAAAIPVPYRAAQRTA
jgi:hypothetical protein